MLNKQTLETRANKLDEEFKQTKSDYEKLMGAKQNLEAKMLSLQGAYAAIQDLLKEIDAAVVPEVVDKV